MRFKLIAGLHQDKRGRNYKKGEVIVTDQDLIKMFDDRKFERLPEEPEKVLTTPAAPEPDALPEDGAGEAEPPEPEAEQEASLGSPPAAAPAKPAPAKLKKKKVPSRKWEDDDE